MSDFRQEWMNTFENKTKSSDKEKTRIKAITKTLALPDDRFMEEISKLADLEAFCTYWALEVLLTHADGFTNKGNNYFVYFDPGPDKMYAIPWGVDKTFIPSSYKLPGIYKQRYPADSTAYRREGKCTSMPYVPFLPMSGTRARF